MRFKRLNTRLPQWKGNPSIRGISSRHTKKKARH
jgi:hypothetical protein